MVTDYKEFVCQIDFKEVDILIMLSLMQYVIKTLNFRCRTMDKSCYRLCNNYELFTLKSSGTNKIERFVNDSVRFKTKRVTQT